MSNLQVTCPQCGVFNGIHEKKCWKCNQAISDDEIQKVIDSLPADKKEQYLAQADQKKSSSGGSVKRAGYRSEYGTARNVSMFISFLGWLVFVGGIFVAFMGIKSVLQSQYGNPQGVFVFLTGLGVAVSGLFLIAAGQITRATVDNADHTREILSLLQDKAGD